MIKRVPNRQPFASASVMVIADQIESDIYIIRLFFVLFTEFSVLSIAVQYYCTYV